MAKPKVTVLNKFKVSSGGHWMNFEHCETFNVSVFGFGPGSDEDDEIEFDSIEEFDRYIEMLKSASKQLKKMKAESKK